MTSDSFGRWDKPVYDLFLIRTNWFPVYRLFQVAQEIWVCEKQGIHPWKGDILDYKAQLKKKINK
jgi:hypothetical protein